MREAMLYDSLPEGKVHCRLCAHGCTISEGKNGLCAVRRCIGGKLFTYAYHRVAALHVDPIEKKPLYHFLPGSRSLSLAAMGCNFHCKFCQNASLSQSKPRETDTPGEPATPAELVEMAFRQGCRSISFTYSEPTVFFELSYDTGKLARDAGLKNVFVTNGYLSEAAVDQAVEFLDAANVDLKAFTEDFYHRYCGARLAPVLDTIRRLYEKGVWVEVTTLVIPGRNSSREELAAIARFLVSVSPDLPWHVSAFHPDYQMWDVPPTSLAELDAAWEEKASGPACVTSIAAMCRGTHFPHLLPDLPPTAGGAIGFHRPPESAERIRLPRLWDHYPRKLHPPSLRRRKHRP